MYAVNVFSIDRNKAIESKAGYGLDIKTNKEKVNVF